MSSGEQQLDSFAPASSSVKFRSPAWFVLPAIIVLRMIAPLAAYTPPNSVVDPQVLPTIVQLSTMPFASTLTPLFLPGFLLRATSELRRDVPPATKTAPWLAVDDVVSETSLSTIVQRSATALPPARTSVPYWPDPPEVWVRLLDMTVLQIVPPESLAATPTEDARVQENPAIVQLSTRPADIARNPPP